MPFWAAARLPHRHSRQMAERLTRSIARATTGHGACASRKRENCVVVRDTTFMIALQRAVGLAGDMVPQTRPAPRVAATVAVPRHAPSSFRVRRRLDNEARYPAPPCCAPSPPSGTNAPGLLKWGRRRHRFGNGDTRLSRVARDERTIVESDAFGLSELVQVAWQAAELASPHCRMRRDELRVMHTPMHLSISHFFCPTGLSNRLPADAHVAS